MEKDAQDLMAPPSPNIYVVRRLNSDLSPSEEWNRVEHYSLTAVIDLRILDHIKKTGQASRILDENCPPLISYYEVKGSTIPQPRMYETSTEWGIKMHRGRIVLFPKTSFKMIKKG